MKIGVKNGIVLVLFITILGLFVLPTLTQASMGNVLLRVGSRGPDVIELQTKLNYVGFNVGKADGIFGNLTRQGVVAFQKAHSLVGDGIVGPLTVKSLNSVYLEKQRQTKIANILNTSKQYLGIKYQWGGTSPGTGFDCSGFVSYVFSKNGVTLPRISRDQYTVGTAVAYGNLQPGDLVFFSFAGNGVVDHDGIYLGDGQFINASSSKGVTIYAIGPYWKSVYVGARRVI